MRLIRSPWIETFTDLIASANQSIKITSPYVKSNMVDKLILNRRKHTKIELITSFKLKNYYDQSSDLNALESIINSSGSIKSFHKLHAKTYIFDDKAAIVTSGNLTSGGLVNNYEYGVLIDENVLIKEIVNDFHDLSKNESTGTITSVNINQVKEILSKIPAREVISLPKLTLSSINRETYDGGVQTITSSLSGWKLAVFNCLLEINKNQFAVADINQFIPELKILFPGNNNIEAKIRQQLQFLRDIGLIEFLDKGQYQKLWS